MTDYDNQPDPVGRGALGSDQASAGDTATDPALDAPTLAAGDAEWQRQLDEQREKYLRLAAEFDNARRRWTKEREETRSRAQADLVRQLVDALDDIGRFAHVDPTTTDAATVVQGVEMVEKKLGKMLTGAGLEVIDPVGQPFDPALHEAVGTEPAGAREDDHLVARVYQLGYRFAGQLLRPSRVVVKQYNG